MVVAVVGAGIVTVGGVGGAVVVVRCGVDVVVDGAPVRSAGWALPQAARTPTAAQVATKR